MMETTTQEAPPDGRASTTAATLTVLTAALSACGGGGGGANNTNSNTPPPATPTFSDASRFLSQAALGGNTADLNAVMSQGYAAWLDAQFTQSSDSSHWDWLIAKGFNDPSNINTQAGIDATLWRKLMSSPDALRQRIALALSEIFVVSLSGLPISWRAFAAAAYMDMLTANAFGNFRSLLEAVTLSPAMGVYLGTRGNVKANPATGSQADENYGREVMQLFTIGLYQLNLDGSLQRDGSGNPVPTYSQDTITNIAKVFTGWNFAQPAAGAADYQRMQMPMTLNSGQHASDAKSLLGISIPAGTDGTAELKMTLDALFNHSNTAPFFARQLIQRLVTSNPSPAYIQRVAQVFVQGDGGVRGDLKSVIRAVLLDSEARSPDLTSPTYGKLREPILRAVQWARCFKVTSPSGNWAIGDTSDPGTRLGQAPMRSPSVFNFFRPGYVPPNNALGVANMVAPEMQIVNESSVVGYLNAMQTLIAGKFADLQPDYSTELALVNDVAGLLAHLNTILAAGQIPAGDIAAMQTALTSIDVSTSVGQQTRVAAAIMLAMASPDYLVQK